MRRRTDSSSEHLTEAGEGLLVEAAFRLIHSARSGGHEGGAREGESLLPSVRERSDALVEAGA